MKKPMRKVKKFEAGGSSYTGDDPIVKYRMGKMSADEANIALGRPDMVKGSLSQEEEKSPVRSMAKPAEVKTETKAETKPERIFNETGTEFFRNPESGALYNLEDTPKPAKPAAKKAPSSSSSSTTASNAKPAAKVETKAEPKAETKTKTEPKKPYDSNEANAAIKAQSKLDSEYTPPKPPPSPGRLGFKGDFFSGRPYGADKFEKEQRSKRSMAAEGNYKKGGSVKMASGGKVSSASKRADGCALRGKTRA